jgi:hypothetical protein
MLTILSGLAAGTAHVVSGPDHLAALAPIAADDPKHARSLGFQWGLGHGLGAITLGGLGMLTRDLIDVHALSAWAEFFVGFVLLGVGLWAFRRAGLIVVHAHAHDHDHDHDHDHMHVHHGDVAHDQDPHETHSHAAMAVGMLHGAAGTGHVLAVVPSLALPPQQAAVYLAAYFVAAILSMTGFGELMGRVVRGGRPRALQATMYATSLAAVLIGVVWVGQSWPV